MPQPIPLPITLFLICAIILPLAGIVIGLILWPRLKRWHKAGVILLAFLVLVFSFLAPGYFLRL